MRIHAQRSGLSAKSAHECFTGRFLCKHVHVLWNTFFPCTSYPVVSRNSNERSLEKHTSSGQTPDPRTKNPSNPTLKYGDPLIL